MDVQSILSLAIQVIFMSFVSLVFIDFVNTVFDACTLAYTAAKIQQLHSSSIHQIALPLPTLASEPILALAQPAATSEFVPIENPWTAPQFDQLPDPWFSTDIPPTTIQQEPVVLEFPRVRLLPPAAPQVQPKAKATKKSTKSTQPKSTKTSKTNQPKTAVTLRKSRKKLAA